MVSHDAPQDVPSAGAGELPSDPAMPVVPSAELYAGSPKLLVDTGVRHSLGWQDHRRAGPGFVVVRLTNLGQVKVVERFPLTEQGWASAWRTLADLDPAAATVVARRLAQLSARQNAVSALAARDAESVRTLAHVKFTGGSGAPVLSSGQFCDVRFLSDRVMVCPSGSATAAAEIRYPAVEAVEVSGTNSARPTGEVVALILVLGILGALLGLFLLGKVGLIVGTLVFALIGAAIGSASAGAAETTVRIKGGDAEYYFVQSGKRADVLRIELSEPLLAIERARAVPAASAEASPAEGAEDPVSVVPESVPDQLTKLASLLQQDLITREEFDQLKADVIARSG